MPGSSRQRHDEHRISIDSVSVGKKANVQHRSDLLMDEQLRNVRQSQHELQSALQEMESAKSVEDLETLRIEVAELKAHSQKMVLALQVMGKINKELAYARNDLYDALHKGIGDINAARKRVIWLEDKMGELCGKKRLKSRRPSNRFVTDPNYGWDTDSEGDQTHRRMRPLDSTERMYASDQNRHQSLTQLLGSEIGFTSDSEHNMMPRHVGFQDHSSHSYESQEVSTAHTAAKAALSFQEDVSFMGPEGYGGGRAIDHRKSLHDSMLSLTSTGHAEIAEESGSEKFSTVKEMSVIGASPVKRTSTPGYTDEKLENGKVIDVAMSMGSHEASEDSFQEKETDDTKDRETTRLSINIDINQAGYGERDEEEKKEDEEQEKEYDDDDDDDDDSCYERGRSEEEEEKTDGEDNQDEESEAEISDRKREKSAFMTEIGDVQNKDTNQEEEIDENSGDSSSSAPSHHDLGAEYWQSEHHRFAYGEFADILTQLDPLSYHQMGLAVPGSFINKEDTQTEFDELPWRPRRKGSDIKDVHRIALDKLAVRMHGIYDKVYNAAMLSVRQSSQLEKMPKGASVFQSFESGKVKPGSSSTKASDQIPQTAPAALRQKTEDKLSLPLGQEMKRGGTFVPGRLVFYPKPIPPPQVLPITRTSLNKEYPQFASSFAKPDPEERKPAERLVDQRNLMEETKLVLYREKVKPSTPGPTRLERRFRKMLEKDRAASNKSSGMKKEKIRREEARKKIKTGFKTAAAFTKLKVAIGGWNDIKPQSRGNEYSGLRWERVKTIIHMNLPAERAEERIDAARQLGILRCGDTMVFYALKDRLHSDPDERVRYEAAKSLILIGCWEDEVLQIILKFLVLGNTEIRGDIIQTLIDGKNVQYVDKTISSFLELVKVLSHFCQNPDPDDLIAFNSAICLGRLCVRDENAKARLIAAVKESKESEIKAKGLEILVKQLSFIDDEIVEHVLELLHNSSVWRYRALACRLLISLGPKHKCVTKATEEIYKLLERKLWDDPSMEVRLAAAKALTALGMFSKACDSVERRLEDVDEEPRSQAAISVGTLGMKSEKLIRLLLEMLELDSSDYVRLMIIRTFAILRLTDKRVLRCLREREKLEGPLARESGKALKSIEVQAGPTSKSWSGVLPSQKPFTKRRVLSPITVGVI